MRLFGRNTLNKKLTLIVVAAVLSAVCVIAGASLWLEARRHTQAKLDYMSASASVFAAATSRATAREDAQEALLAIRGIARAPHLLYARIETAEGNTLAEIGSAVTMDSDAHVSDGDPGSLLTALRSRTLEVSQPIIHGGAEIGRVVLVADNSDLWPSLMMTLLQTLLGAAAALVVAIVIGARLQHWVVRPLLKLTDAVRHISQSHDYATRVKIESDDEVGDLVTGFNAMLFEIKDREAKIIDLALHDAETDLPNRNAFERALASRLEAPRKEGVLAVAAISVDRFQYVRGFFGYHMAGDILGELGARAAVLGARGIAARISTDLIGFLIEAPDIDTLRAKASAILARAEAPMQLGANLMDVSLSMGLAIVDASAAAPQPLIERASIALDQARAARTKFALFDETAYAETAANLSLMSDMTRAMMNGEMTIHLQPKYDLRRSAIDSAEVLVRWRNPARGFVSPDVFVVMAEETGAIGVLTQWVMEEAIATQDRLAKAGIPVELAVNLSGRLLCDPDFIQITLGILQRASTPLRLEITETGTIDNQAEALAHIEALVKTGARISIDDYGSGLSSLAYLKQIPADELKIDKAFIQTLGQQQRDALLVKSTIDLAHSLGMQVTAEGVENEMALAALAAMGCDYAQGYYIAKPMSEADFITLMNAKPDPLLRSAGGNAA